MVFCCADLLCGWCSLAVVALIAALWFFRDTRKVSRIHEKHVLITGCDSGFGHLAARQLDRQGFLVIAACLTEAGASRLRAAASPRLKTLLLNVTDSASIERAVDRVRSETGDKGLWGLVNNAGVSLPVGPMDWMQLQDFRRVLDVNLIGLIAVTLKCLPLLKKAKGRVMNVASILGRLSIIGGGYCLSKWGVEAFSDSLRRDMIHFGVKVSIIEPGFFKTPVTDLGLIEDDLEKRWNNLPAEVRTDYGDSYLQDYLNVQAFSMRILASSDLSKVTSRMQHAIQHGILEHGTPQAGMQNFSGSPCHICPHVLQTSLLMHYCLLQNTIDILKPRTTNQSIPKYVVLDCSMKYCALINAIT